MPARAEQDRGLIVIARCVVQRNEDDKILLIRRKLETEYFPGGWEVPGGKYDGADLLRTFLREVFEETRLTVQINHQVGAFDTYASALTKYLGRPYLGLTALSRLVGGKVRLSKEHTNYAWTGLDRVDRFNLTQDTAGALHHLISSGLLIVPTRTSKQLSDQAGKPGLPELHQRLPQLT